MNTTYQTLIVKFSEPIAALDGIFDDAQAWGTDIVYTLSCLSSDTRTLWQS